MTTGTGAGAPPAIPELSAYGLIAGDTSGLADVHGMAGGPGTARWKTLINGMHLPGRGWKIVEYVELPPGAGCGRHPHYTCEEIYFIVSGQAQMTINDLDEITVRAGDAVTCPLGTIHGIKAPASASEPVTFFVVEMFPGGEPPNGTAEIVPMPALMDYCPGWRSEDREPDTRVAVLSLGSRLTGPWRQFSLIDIPPDGVLGPYRLPLRVNEVLFTVAGEAEITVGPETLKGRAGLTVGTPLNATVTVRNLSPGQPLVLASTEAAA